MKLKEAIVYILDGDQGSSLFSVFISIDYNFRYGEKLRYMVPTKHMQMLEIFSYQSICAYT